MDKESLQANKTYQYIVIPGIIDFSLPKNCNTIFYYEFLKGCNDIVSIYNDQGRVFIPVFDFSNRDIYPYYQGKNFCGGKNLTVLWCWTDSTGQKLPKDNNFRGADSLLVEISPDKFFKYGSLRKSKGVKLEIFPPDKNYQMILENWNSNLDIGTYDSVFLQITSFDKWKNRGCSISWDEPIFLIHDDRPPNAIDSLKFSTKASETHEENYVDIFIHCQRPFDLSGTRDYTLHIDSLTTTGYTLFDTISFKVGASDNYKQKGDSLDKNIFIHSISNADRDTVVFKRFLQARINGYRYDFKHFRYKIEARDFFRNKAQTTDNDSCFYRFLPAPAMLSVKEDPTNKDLVLISWSKINIDTFTITWCDTNSIYFNVQWIDSTVAGLGKDGLSNKSTNEHYIKITKKEINPNNIRRYYFFHLKALAKDKIKKCWIQSPWSNYDSIKIGDLLFSHEEIINTTNVYSEDNMHLPDNFALAQNHPNPFNNSTIINFQLPKSCWVNLSIYNIIGEKIHTLIDEFKPAGFYSVIWKSSGTNSKEFTSGIYFIIIQAEEFKDTKKCLLLK